MPAFVVSVVLLAIGGMAVFFHLQHWERIFNGFGHITSGITQELILVVVVLLCMVLTFAFARKRTGNLPRGLCTVNIVAAAALVLVMGHSYMMPARPAWDSVLQVLSLVGNACVLGLRNVLRGGLCIEIA